MFKCGLIIGIVGVMLFATYWLSSWPRVLWYRYLMNRAGAVSAQRLAAHVPQGIAERLNERYTADRDARLDIFFPSAVEASDKMLPTIVWVHGGGWISGTKDHTANYTRILAGKGYTAANVEYSLAPGKTHPHPVQQLFDALAYLQAHNRRLHVDSSRFVLAGDSAGAHIVAQAANVVTSAAYAKLLQLTPSIQRSHLLGVMLYCGPYDIQNANLQGSFGDFLKTVLWSYSGGKDFKTNPAFAAATVIRYVTPAFPATFISAGNADPLLPHSLAIAQTLKAQGVTVTTLFFPENYSPALPHEYQFNLDTEAGRMALELSTEFLANLVRRNPQK
jgi:acetyl esterase